MSAGMHMSVVWRMVVGALILPAMATAQQSVPAPKVEVQNDTYVKA